MARTFTHIFCLKPNTSHFKSVNHFYQNPIRLTKEYGRLIDTGKVKNQTNLALKLCISKVRIVLSLLKLNDDLTEAVEKTGDPMPTRCIEELLAIVEVIYHLNLHHDPLFYQKSH